MRMLLVALLTLVCLTPPAAAVAQSTPSKAPAQEGFVPVDDLPAQEQLPAAPLVAIAYGFVWAAVLLYVWSLWRRLGRVEREFTELQRRLEQQERRASGAEWATGPAQRSEPGGVQGAPPTR